MRLGRGPPHVTADGSVPLATSGRFWGARGVARRPPRHTPIREAAPVTL